MVPCRLQQEGVQLSRPWQGLLAAPLFEEAASSCAALDRMVAVFVERSHSLFKARCPPAQGTARQLQQAQQRERGRAGTLQAQGQGDSTRSPERAARAALHG